MSAIIFVAIEVLPPEKVADAERKRRFVQEAKAASALNHPNIIHIVVSLAEHAAAPSEKSFERPLRLSSHALASAASNSAGVIQQSPFADHRGRGRAGRWSGFKRGQS